VGKALRSKWGLLALVAAMVVGMATIPAAGEHAPEEVDQLRLHLGTDGNYFRHVPVEGTALADQPINVGGNCLISTNNSLASFGGKVGYHNQSLGIKTGGSKGVPCSRIDSNEQLSINLVGVSPATAADFDLELKGDVHLVITASLGESLVGTFNVYSGSFVEPGSTDDSTVPYEVLADPDADCRGAADSGPDSGINDNCRVTIDPGVPFDNVTFKPMAGEVSLEGGGDFGNDPAYETVFYLQTEQWDGELACGQQVSTEPGSFPEGTITRYDNVTTGVCEPKLYRLFSDSEEETITFELFDPATTPQQAWYQGELTLPGDLANPTTSVQLEIATDAPNFLTFETVPVCVDAPFLDAEETVPNPSALPGDAEACVVSVFQNWEGNTVWTVVFKGDPKFR
jgi:hypothetical protein